MQSKINPPTLITILGPTATGKTSLAAHTAHRLGAEIISADSRQVYRGMNIGTGKDYEDYIIGDTSIPVHLIDIKDPGYEFSIFDYQQEFLKVYEDIKVRGKIPILCGGSGLYIDAILRSYDLRTVPKDEKLRQELKKKPEEELIRMLEGFGPLHNKTDITDKERLMRAIEIRSFYSDQDKQPEKLSLQNIDVFGINFERPRLRENITRRLRDRLDNGMIEEVQALLDKIRGTQVS